MIVRVSDHALLRYFQRIAGIDVEVFRAQLAERLERGAGAAESIGGGQYIIRIQGAGFVVKDGVVVTTLSREQNGMSIAGEAR